MKRILVARERHITRYLDASSDIDWATSALKLLTERWKNGLYTNADRDWYHQVEDVVVDRNTRDIRDGDSYTPIAWELLNSRANKKYEYVALEEVECNGS